MVSMDGRTRTCDLCIPNAERYQLRYIHIRNYRTFRLQSTTTRMVVGYTRLISVASLYCIIKNVKDRGGVCRLPHHKGRESFSIHQILMKISFQRFSASVELLTMSKNSVTRVVRSHCKCRKDFSIRQIFGRIFSCWL